MDCNIIRITNSFTPLVNNLHGIRVTSKQIEVCEVDLAIYTLYILHSFAINAINSFNRILSTMKQLILLLLTWHILLWRIHQAKGSEYKCFVYSFMKRSWLLHYLLHQEYRNSRKFRWYKFSSKKFSMHLIFVDFIIDEKIYYATTYSITTVRAVAARNASPSMESQRQLASYFRYPLVAGTLDLPYSVERPYWRWVASVSAIHFTSASVA